MRILFPSFLPSSLQSFCYYHLIRLFDIYRHMQMQIIYIAMAPRYDGTEITLCSTYDISKIGRWQPLNVPEIKRKLIVIDRNP